MKKNFTYSTIYVIIYFLLGCTSQTNIPNELGEFSINIESDVQLKDMLLSNFIDSISTVILETTEESLMSKSSNIEIYQNQIFISDATTQKLMIFSNNGKFLKSLHKQGPGPEEYIQLTDFSIMNNTIYILDMIGRSILNYDLEFNFIDKVKLTTPALNLIASKNNIWIYNIFGHTKSDDDFEIINIDQNHQTSNLFKRKYLKDHNVNSLNTWVEGNVFHSLNGDIYYSERFSNNIYKLEDNNPYLYINVDFGKYSISQETNVAYYESIFYSEEFPYLVKEYFFISNRYNIIKFQDKKGRPCYAFQNKETLKTDVGFIKNDIISNYCRFIPIFAKDDILIEPISAPLVFDEDFRGIIDFNPSLQNISEEDNFILILYHLKK